MKRLLPSHHPFHLSFLNASLMLLALIANSYWQVFCRPSLWASILLLAFFLHLTFYPLLRHRKVLAPILGFLNALSAAVCLYCIVFLEQMNLWGLPMILWFGMGLLVYIPHFLGLKALFKSVIQPAYPEER